mgnify:CR=1 FL=1
MKKVIDKDYELAITSSKPFTFDRFVRLLIAITSAVAIILIIKSLSSVLIPFIIAFILAYLINPLVNFFQNRVKIKHRGVSVFITIVLIIAAFTGIFWWLIPRILTEINYFSVLFKKYIEKNYADGFFPENISLYLKNFIDKNNFQDLINAKQVKEVGAIILKSLKSLFSGSLSIIFGVVGFLLILLYLFFILLDYKRLEDKWLSLIPLKHRSLLYNIVEDLKASMRVYLRAQGTIAMIVGILMAIGFSIIKLPMAITFGLFIGLLNIIPYLQIVGLIPALFLGLLKAMETGQSFIHVILMILLVMAIIQVIQETILMPRIMGKAYNMNPAIILLSLSIWGSIMGILGMLLALPLTTVLTSYYRLFIIKDDKNEEEVDEAEKIIEE